MSDPGAVPPRGVFGAPPRTSPRGGAPVPNPGDQDMTEGCGEPPPGVISGRVCAGVGDRLSCQLCPQSPTYWNRGAS